MGKPIQLRSPIGMMELFDDGVIVHTIDEGALVDGKAATGVLESTRMLAKGNPVAVVVDLRGVAFADQGSRGMFAADPSGGVEIATALVAGPRVSQFLAELFLREKPARPTSVFDEPKDARAWAAEQVQVHSRSDAAPDGRGRSDAR